jgi:hypothetical protein
MPNAHFPSIYVKNFVDNPLLPDFSLAKCENNNWLLEIYELKEEFILIFPEFLSVMMKFLIL